MILLAGLLIKIDRYSLFKYRHQFIYFGLFLFIIFISQAFSGSGRILFQTMPGISITETGLENGLFLTSQILMIFMLVQLITLSTAANEIGFYAGKLQASRFPLSGSLNRYLLIAWYVLRDLPVCFENQKEVNHQIKGHPDYRGQPLMKKAGVISEAVYQFIYSVLSRAAREYPVFIRSKSQFADFHPRPVLNRHHGIFLLGMLLFHGMIFWKFLV